MRSGWLCAMAFCLLVVAVAPAGASQPAASSADPGSVCQGNSGSDSVRAVTVGPAGENVTDAGPFYAGTELYLVLCDGSTREITDTYEIQGAGVRVVNTNDTYYEVQLTGETGTVDLGAAVGQRASGPSVNLTTGAQASTRLVDQPIPFTNATLARDYERAETRFNTSLAEVRNTTDRLNRTTSSIRNGTVNETILGAANETLRALRENTTAVRNSTRNASAVLYANVRGGVPNSVYSWNAKRALDISGAEATENASAALAAYYEALGERRAAIASTIRTNFLLGAGLGLLVGLLLGAFKPHRSGKEVDHYRDYNSQETYDRSVVYLPVGVGVAVVLAAVALLLFGDSGVLQVMLP